MFEHVRISYNALNTVLICKIGLKYQYTFCALCAYAHVFRKRPGCGLIGACAIIRTKTVFRPFCPILRISKKNVPIEIQSRNTA